jgi:hypothetical protein
MKSFPVLTECLGIIVGDRRSLIWHGLLLAGLLLILLLAWPVAPLDVYLHRGTGPRVYPALFLVTAIYLFIASTAFTFERAVTVAPHPFVRWVRFTPVSPGAYLIGRHLFHLVHTLFLAILVTPFLAIAGTLSGVSPAYVLIGIAALSGVLLCYRLAAEGFRSLEQPTGVLPALLFNAILVAYLLLTATPAPQWSAAVLLSVLASGDPGGFTDGQMFRTFGLHIFLALTGTIVAYLRLRRRGEEEKKR